MSVRRAVIATAAAVLAAGTLPLLGGPAAADANVPLPGSGFRAVLADSHGHVYVTSGHGSTSVWVGGVDGAALTTIPSMDGAAGMALSADGTTLYVALYDGAAVAAIDTTSLTETHRYAMPSTCPDSVAVAGGALWVGVTCDAQWSYIDNVELATGTVTQPTMDQVYNPLLLADPTDGTVLYAGSRGLSPSSLVRYTVSGTTLTPSASVSPGSGFADMAFDGNGTDIVTASASPSQHNRFARADLATDGSYASNDWPDSVATSGTLVAAGSYSPYSTDVNVYRAGTLVRSIDFGTGDELQADGLALSPDGSRLYAVTATHTLHVITAPGAAASTLVLTGPSTGTRGIAYSVSGVLTSGGAPVVGAAVAATRTDLSGVKHYSLTTDATGKVTAKDTPLVGGPVTWTFSYAGNALHRAVTTKKVVTIARATTTLTIVPSASKYKYGATATLTVHLGTTYNSRTVSVYARPLATSVKAPGTLVARARVDSHGNLVVHYRMVRRTTFTAAFAGDYRYNPRTATTSPNVISAPVVQPGGYASYSNGIYYFTGGVGYFRATSNPARYDGCATWTAQRLQGSSWVTLPTACFAFESDHFSYASFSSSLKNVKYRIRVSVGSNSYSLAGVSAWKYFMFR